MRLLVTILILCSFASAACTTGGSGFCEVGSGKTYADPNACLSVAAAGQTCLVFAGTYTQTVSVPAGTAGNYISLVANASDVISIVGSVTMHSHTKLVGNCPEKQGTVTTASCGFFIANTAAPTTAACISLPSSATDIYIRDNVMYACGAASSGMIVGSGNSYIYIQGNTLSYSGVTTAQAGTTIKEGNGTELDGNSNHILEENNDLSHYTLGFCCGDQTYFIIRNNNVHDQYETEARANAHTDAFYWSPNVTTAEIVVEGNYQYNGIGPNAKGILNQGEYSPCLGTCGGVLIYRFNLVNHIGGGNTSSYGWNHFMVYNNTYYDVAFLCSSSCGGDNMFTDTYSVKNWADINNIWYYPTAQVLNETNPLAADSASSATGRWGYSLAYCNASGASNCSLFGHQYEQGTWTGDTGNILGYIGHSPSNNPNFVNTGTDFHLQAGSPAIAAGTYLATANGSGSNSTTLVVNDASYFQDSYGLSNGFSTVSPDCISVTTVSNHVCITAVNYSTNTLTLASPISWSNGDFVWLYSKSDGVQVLTGSAPDMGALPFSGIIPLVGCGPTIFYGPPNYPCGSPSTTNPGQVTYYFQSTNPQWTGNTSNGAISPCTANCMQWVSGDQFLTSWQTGVGAGNGGNILLGGGVGHVNTSGTAITWVDGTPFSTAWSGTMTIAGVARTLVSCTSATACTVTVTPGTLTGAGYSVKGTAYGVSVWNSATVATLMSAPGTQTGVQMLDQTACKLITALDHTPAFGCQNAVSHDPTLPGYVSGSNLITQIADQGSSVNGLPVGNLTPSGGDNDRIWSKPNETYLWIVNSGGSAQPMQISTASGYVQVVNSSTACPGYVPPYIPSAMSTGWLSDTRYYYAANGTQIFQGDLTGTGCTLAIQASPTMLVDVEAAGVCPGIPSGLTLSGIMGVGGNGSGTILDDTFTMGLNYAGGQGHGDWIVSWSRTRGCWTANLHTGQVWAFCTSSCTSSTPALGTMATGSTNCWGLDGSTGNGTHDQQTDGLGIYVFVSSDDSNGYTAGGCTGTTEALIQLQIGTLNNFWTDSVTLGGNKVIGNHQMVGITNIVSNAFAAMTYSPMNNLPAYVTYANFPLSNGAPVHDIHQGLVEECTGLGSYSDRPCPIIGNTDTVLSTQLSGCTGSGAFVAAVYCPTAYSNMLTVMFPFGGFPSPLLTFAHTGSCGGISNGCADQIPSGFGDIDSIGVPSPKGDIFCWSSTMWHQLGYDRNVAPADEAFCMYFGQPKLAIAPATGLFAHVTKNFNAHFPISGGSK